MYDLNLYPIKTEEGRADSLIEGFLAVGPPRRIARSRSDDLLLFSLFIQGNDSLSPEIQKAWLQRLAQSFYKASGTVTSALRTLIETLNLTMMEQNLKLAQDGGGIRAAINLTAVHRRSLYIAQSGYLHAYVLTQQGLQYFSDTSGSDRGLGFSRSPSIRYYQADLDAGGYLFLTDTPPETWTEELLFGDEFPNLEQLRRRLLNQAPATFRLDLAQIMVGKGDIHIHQPKPKLELVSERDAAEPETKIISHDAQEEADSSGSTDDGAISDTQKIHTLPPQDIEKVAEEPSIPESEEEIDVEDEVLASTAQASVPDTSNEGAVSPQDQMREEEGDKEQEEVVSPSKKPALKTKKAFHQKTKELREDGLKGMTVFFDWWHQAREKVRTFFKDLMVRFSPEAKGESLRLSKGTLLFIAVAVPILVVTIAVSVYLVRGRTLQYQEYLAQAIAASDSAKAIGDPTVARDLWSQTLTFLDNAEEFKSTEDITELRGKAQDALDALDGAVRLAYQPAISGVLYSEINITRIVSYGMDLYLFDATDGRVIHATRADQGYEVDPDFICSAGAYSTGTVGTLVDIVSLPINNPYQAQILAVDALGNVAYCAPGQGPVVQSLPAPGAGVGETVKIAYEYNHLYVLNPISATVQIYTSKEGQFLDPPDDYFDGARVEEIPDFTKIVDMAVNGPELYLLRTDGMMVDCIYSGLPDNPVTCEQPVDYIDGRSGREDQMLVMPEASYVSVLYTSPPDPSVSILDATNADIYRFSLRFRIYRRLRPDLGDFEVESPTATAFTIGIDQIAFIAFGNQVFYAYVE
ncbi:MAG: hypothetical protein U9R53_06905 [Chloroflexota bacterium]|nr:hypothetical protein [Chloroflexota bacterium]